MEIIDIVKDEFIRRMNIEGLSRIEKCLNQLTDEELWHKQNSNTNSVGNLVLHLSGNVRQYIISGVGQEKDIRERDKEFLSGSRITKEALINQIKATISESINVVNKLTQQHLTEDRRVQGFDENVLSIIIHVIEHFSYHVGQITYFTKYLKDIDTGYYAGLDLNITD